MEELARSISDFIGSSWRALALLDRVRDRIGDCLHFKAANRAIASDAAGILAAIQRIVRRSQRLVRPARCSLSGTLDLASRRMARPPRMRRRSMLLVAASAENTTSSRVVTSWILGVSTRSAVTVASSLLIALACREHLLMTRVPITSSGVRGLLSLAGGSLPRTAQSTGRVPPIVMSPNDRTP